MGTSSVLVIVPAHNEAGRIGAVVAAIVAQGLPVLVVDDGSADATGGEASAAGAQVLRLEPNRGKGEALKAGFREALSMRAGALQGSAAGGAGTAIGSSEAAAASGEAASVSGEAAPRCGDAAPGRAAFLTLDGDGQHDPAEIPQFLATWERSGADLVVGMRDYGQMPPIRWFTNTVSRILFSWAVRQPVPDNQCGYRLHTRRVAEAALASEEQGFAFEVEEIAICVGRGYPLGWVPIKTIYGTEKSDIKPWTHFSSFVRVMRRARARMRAERRAAAGSAAD